MFKSLKKLAAGTLVFFLCIGLNFATPHLSRPVLASDNVSKIHFLTLPDNTDAILLECNGKFGMVDSGEDNDSPSGKDSRYPSRAGTVVGFGYESEVIDYLHSMGVTPDNFEFYIGTHPHSDHIGSADEIIYEFRPKRVYIEKYSDSDVSLNSKLWDNLYVYDHMVTAAMESGSTLIQTFKKDAPLYPETQTITGTIQWNPPENVDFSTSAPIPETISIVLEYQTSDTETALPANVSGEVTPITDDSGNLSGWSYHFNEIQKFDDTKTTFDYLITPESEGYQFTSIPDSAYNFICQPISSSETNTEYQETLPEQSGLFSESSGPVDEPARETENSETDSLQTEDIAATDLVDADHPSDPTNSNRDTYAAPGQTSSTADITGYTSTPEFYLGGKNGMKIEIVNYGVPRPQEDANDFCLGVKVTSVATGKTAFFSGDINNKLGAETVLSTRLGQINLLKIGHHGAYGSNTYSYLNSLNPEMMVLTGKFNYVSDDLYDTEQKGTLEILLEKGKNGIPLYVTEWYSENLPALVICLDNNLSNNIPPQKSQIACAYFANPPKSIYYYDGLPVTYDGWLKGKENKWYYFANSCLATSSQWIKNPEGKWLYLKADGAMATGWLQNGGYWYYLDADGFITTGWQKIDNIHYYLNNDGHMLTGRQKLGEDYYYFNQNTGAMVSDTYIDGQYYNSNGKWQPNFKDSNWILDSNGWWYRFADGSYPKNTWIKIHGLWYYFYENGYMASDWLLHNGNWYYMGKGGDMKTGWQLVNGSWYYLNNSGGMQTGWISNGGNWYYTNVSGAMLTGWINTDGCWYYMNSSGAMLTGWQYINKQWYYLNSSGKMLIGWLQLNGSWYYLNNSGAMQTGWVFPGDSWYYMSSSGTMLTGWQLVNHHWYYLKESGKMVTGWLQLGNSWYYLNSSGAMLSNTWTPDGYYINGSGIWTGERK